MTSPIQIISIAGSVAVILLVAQLIRKRKLREEYGILWFLSSLVLILFSLDTDLLNRTAAMVGISYAPSLLLLGAIFLGFLIAMHFSVSLSALSEQNKALAQEVALLRWEISRAKRADANQQEEPSTR